MEPVSGQRPERVRIRWADRGVIEADVVRRFKNGRIRVEFTPSTVDSGFVRGRAGTPARREQMTVESWQVVE